MRYAVLAALLLAGPAAAQGAAPDPYDAGLRAAAGLHALAASPAVAPHRARRAGLLAAQARRNRTPGYAFLVVGGAVAVAGLLTDEDLLVIGGVAVAGYGLYLNIR